MEDEGRKRVVAKRYAAVIGVAVALVIAVAVVLMVVYIPSGSSSAPTSTPTPTVQPTQKPPDSQVKAPQLTMQYRIDSTGLGGNSNCNVAGTDFGRLVPNNQQDYTMARWYDGGECANMPFFMTLRTDGTYDYYPADPYDMYGIQYDVATQTFSNVYSLPLAENKLKELFVQMSLSETGNSAATSFLDAANNGTISGYLRTPGVGWTFLPALYPPTGGLPNYGRRLLCTDTRVLVSATQEPSGDRKAVGLVYAADWDKDALANANANTIPFQSTVASGFPLQEPKQNQKGDDTDLAFGLVMAKTTDKLYVSNYEHDKVYAYNYSNSSVKLAQTVPAPQNAAEKFGYALAAYNNYLAVGSYGNVYIYRDSKLIQTLGWPNTMVLQDDKGAAKNFGERLSMTEDYLLVYSFEDTKDVQPFTHFMHAYRRDVSTGMYEENTTTDPQTVMGEPYLGSSVVLTEDPGGSFSVTSRTANSFTRFNSVVNA